MFDLLQFVADCREAMAVDKSHKYVRRLVALAVSDPAAVRGSRRTATRLGEPIVQPTSRAD
jgi:hypothetical protein